MIPRLCMFSAVVVLFFAGLLWSDVVVLYNGDHIEGHIVDESDDEISLLRDYKTGHIKYVQKIKRARVVRIVRGKRLTTTKPSVVTSTRPPATRAVLDSIPTDKQRSILAGIIRQFKEKAYSSAGIKITRLINHAAPGQLHRLSAEVNRQLEMSLADLAAEIHWAQVMEGKKGGSIRLKYITGYEKPSLVAKLAKAYAQALRCPIRVETAEPKDVNSKQPKAETQTASQPAESSVKEYAISDWLEKQTEFDGDEAESEVFSAHIRYTMSLLRERMRLDPALKWDRDLRKTLYREKVELMALNQAVVARGRGALTPAERAAILAERRRQLELYRREMERRQKRDEVFARKILEQIEDEQEREQALKKFHKEMERRQQEREAYFQNVIPQGEEKQVQISGEQEDKTQKEGG